MTTSEYIGRMLFVSCMFVGYIMFFLKGIPLTAISISDLVRNPGMHRILAIRLS